MSESLPEEPTPPLPPDSSGHQVVPMLLMLGTFCAGLVLAGVAHHALVGHVEPFYVDREMARQKKLIDALPEVVRAAPPTGVIIGASTLARLDPLVMDARLRTRGVELTTWNLSQNGAPPVIDELVARRLRDLCLEQHRRLAVAILDVSITLLTSADRDRYEHDSFRYDITYTGDGLKELARDQPTVALVAAFRKYALGDALDGDMNELVTQRVFDAPWHCRIQPPEGSSAAEAQRIHDFCDAERALVPGGYEQSWHRETRGFDLPTPRPLMTVLDDAMGFDRRRTDEAMRANFERHIARLEHERDTLGAHFDERSVADLMRAAKDLSEVADHVVFLVSPENPLTTRKADAEARIAALLERLRATAPVLDLRRAPQFEQADFWDALHIAFTPTATEKLATAVADGLAPMVESR